MPHETPPSMLRSCSLLARSELGVEIVPAMTTFDLGPRQVQELEEFVVDRALPSARLDLSIRHAGDRKAADARTPGEEP